MTAVLTAKAMSQRSPLTFSYYKYMIGSKTQRKKKKKKKHYLFSFMQVYYWLLSSLNFLSRQDIQSQFFNKFLKIFIDFTEYQSPREG